MNTITMLGGSLGPYWMGVMKDATGSYWMGLRGLIVPSLAAAALMFVLTRSLAQQKRARVAREELVQDLA
jgi:cyanate permease